MQPTEGCNGGVSVDPFPSAVFCGGIGLDLRDLRFRQADLPVIPCQKGL